MSLLKFIFTQMYAYVIWHNLLCFW